jgi:hypothetical protein
MADPPAEPGVPKDAIDTSHGGPVWILAVSGEHDLSTAPNLVHDLGAAGVSTTARGSHPRPLPRLPWITAQTATERHRLRIGTLGKDRPYVLEWQSAP